MFYGLSPFALSYFSLMFSCSEEGLLPGQGKDGKNSFGRRFLGSYGTFLFFAVLMGIVMSSSSFLFPDGAYMENGIRYGIALFLAGMLILWCRQWEERLPVFWVGLCAFAGQLLAAVVVLLLNQELAQVSIRRVLIYLFEAVLSFVLTVLFAPGVSFLTRYRSGCAASQEELLSATLLITLFFEGCPVLFVGGLSVRLALMLLFILCAAYFYGAGAGAMSGLLLGIAQLVRQMEGDGLTKLSEVLRKTADGSGEGKMLLLFLILGTVAGVTRHHKRPVCVFTAVFTTLFTAFLTGGGAGRDGLFAFLAAGGFFLLLPGGWCIRSGEMKSRRLREPVWTEPLKGNESDPLFAVVEDKLKQNAYAFERLTKYFSGLGKEHGELIFPDAIAMVNEVSGRICAECRMSEECHAAALKGNLEAAAGILRAAIFEDDVRGSFFPAEFLKGCIHAEDYLYQMNREVMLARMNLRWQNNMAETKRAIAAQLKEMSQICSRMSEQLSRLTRVDYPGERKLKYVLRRYQIEIREFSMIRTWEEPLEVSMYARAKNGACMTTKELAELVGKQTGLRLRAAKSTRFVLGKEYEKVTLCEDPPFRLQLGVARCAKSDQKISGDSFSCMNLENGTALLSISDGMGSGQEAFQESKAVMNLLEELIEAGFCEETAIRLIHSVLMEHPEKQSFSTLDVSLVNLYTGVLRLVKIGGAATYLKQSGTVETIQSATLPMGIYEQPDISAIERRLTDGDLVIMMSDGVLEGLRSSLPFETDPSERMAELIAAQGSRNLKELAAGLLKKAGGRENARDDMTVLVAGIYKK